MEAAAKILSPFAVIGIAKYWVPKLFHIVSGQVTLAISSMVHLHLFLRPQPRQC